MQSRLDNPALSVPGSLDALLALSMVAGKGAQPAGLAQTIVNLVNLRACQINGCAVGPGIHSRAAKKTGETDERLSTLAGRRDAPHFTDSERAARALTGAATRRGDPPDPVPDQMFDEAATHHQKSALGVLVVHISAINFANRPNLTTRQVGRELTSPGATL